MSPVTRNSFSESYTFCFQHSWRSELQNNFSDKIVTRKRERENIPLLNEGRDAQLVLAAEIHLYTAVKQKADIQHAPKNKCSHHCARRGWHRGATKWGKIQSIHLWKGCSVISACKSTTINEQARFLRHQCTWKTSCHAVLFPEDMILSGMRAGVYTTLTHTRCSCSYKQSQ